MNHVCLGRVLVCARVIDVRPRHVYYLSMTRQFFVHILLEAKGNPRC